MRRIKKRGARLIITLVNYDIIWMARTGNRWLLEREESPGSVGRSSR